MKKLIVGPRNQPILPHTTIRLVGSSSERLFRLDRLYVRALPSDAAVLVIDVRIVIPKGKPPATTNLILQRAPIPVQAFAPNVSRGTSSPIAHIELRRGEEIAVVITSSDARDVGVSVWFESFEPRDLS